jgi:hypothetical protein
VRDCGDADFARDLKASDPAVQVIAAWLRSHGRRVEVYPQHVRPTFVQRADYYDNGDLGLIDVDPIEKVDVTHRGFSFESRASYPFDTIIVGHIPKLNRFMCAWYISCNPDLTHCAVIKTADTRQHWVQGSIISHWRGCETPKDLYFCPKELATFHRMTE